MFRKLTLRRMKPEARKLGKLLNEMESAVRRGRKMVDAMQQLEIDAAALNGAKGPAPLVSIEAGGRLAHGWPRCPHCGEEVKPERRTEAPQEGVGGGIGHGEG